MIVVYIVVCCGVPNNYQKTARNACFEVEVFNLAQKSGTIHDCLSRVPDESLKRVSNVKRFCGQSDKHEFVAQSDVAWL